MNSPHSRHGSETGLSAEHALRPAVKLMFASATLLAGLGAATVYWNGNAFDDSFFVNHEQVDKKLLDAPLPTPLLAATVPVPETKTLNLPMVPAFETATGNDKYAQAYPPPILVPDKALEEAAKINQPIVPVNYMAEKKLMPLEKEMTPLYSFERPAVPTTMPEAEVLTGEPVQLDVIRESDTLLSEFQEIENMKVMLKKQLPTQPVNPLTSGLVPLQPTPELVSLQPKAMEVERLVPLQPSQGLVTLKPLK